MSRRLRMGLVTVLGLAKRGYFIPHRYAAHTAPSDETTSYTALGQMFEAARPRFKDVLEVIEGFAPALEGLGNEPPPAPRWGQDWFPRLDAACAYALTRHHAPSRVVEVGSGHSTRFLARAVRDGGLDTAVTAIDPEPRATLEALPITLLRKPLQDVPLDTFKPLREGDFLFIDSSHVLMPGTDVDILLNQVLPELPAGVFVHFHDVFLPRGYPAAWSWRGYNEQLGVAALLQGGAYELVFASAFVRAAMAAELEGSVATRLPMPDGAYESSLWLRKRGPEQYAK